MDKCAGGKPQINGYWRWQKQTGLQLHIYKNGGHISLKELEEPRTFPGKKGFFFHFQINLLHYFCEKPQKTTNREFVVYWAAFL